MKFIVLDDFSPVANALYFSLMLLLFTSSPSTDTTKLPCTMA